MVTRILSGAILILFVAAIVVFNTSFPLALNIVVAVISSWAVIELFGAMGMAKRYLFLYPSILCAVALPFSTVLHVGPLIVFVYLTLMFAAQLKEHASVSFKDIGVLMLMSVMIPAALTTLVLIRNHSEEHNMFPVIITILCAWAADAGAYFAGVFFGKHKMCPDISPKKTVEGAIGGFVVNVALMLLCGLAFSYYTQTQVHYFTLFLIGAIGWAYSVLGDLSFSLIKRSCHIKDFSHLIPGHGGILDRFDSVIFVAPFVYFLLTYLPIFG